MKTSSKTFTWSNPTEALAESSRLSGFEVLEAMRDRTLPPPPMAVLINCEILEVAPGRGFQQVKGGLSANLTS